MNIYELEKKATPGPWFGTQSTVLGKTAPEVVRETHICSTDENWLPHAEQDANGALIRHCRNHFMRVLEALKTSNIAMKKGQMPGPWTMLIAELEEVK